MFNDTAYLTKFKRRSRSSLELNMLEELQQNSSDDSTNNAAENNKHRMCQIQELKAEDLENRPHNLRTLVPMASSSPQLAAPAPDDAGDNDAAATADPHSKGWFMNDGRRRIDFVCVYALDENENALMQHLQQRKSLSADDVRNGSAATLKNGFSKLSQNGAAFQNSSGVVVNGNPIMNSNNNQSQMNRQRRNFFQNNLEKEGCQLELETVRETDKRVLVFVKIHLPFNVMAKHAELLKIKTPLKINAEGVGKKPTLVDDLPTSSDTVIYWPFDRKMYRRHYLDWRRRISAGSPPSEEAEDGVSNSSQHQTFRRDSNNTLTKDSAACNRPLPIFDTRHRIEIAWSILQKTPNHPYDLKKRGIESLLEHKVYAAAYPVHEGDCHLGDDENHLTRSNSEKDPERQVPCRPTSAPKIGEEPTPAYISPRRKLRRDWANWSRTFNVQPLDEVRNYFGEKIGFYFAFMDFYVKMLIAPTLFGIAVLIYGFIRASKFTELSELCGDTHLLTAGGSESEGHASSVPATAIHESGDATDYKQSEHQQPASGQVDRLGPETIMCPICVPPYCAMEEMSMEFCYQYSWGWRFDNEGTYTISVLMTLWSILFLKFWRRREARLAFEWSTHDAEEYDWVIRPGYEEKAKEVRANPITLENEPYIPPNTVALKVFISYMFTFLLIWISIGLLALLIISRIALYGGLKYLGGIFQRRNVEFSRWIVHGLIFVTVSLFEQFYHSISHKLTDFECPKTDGRFMKSLLWKLFVFQLLNDFVPIAYAAWLKGRTASTPLDLDMFSELCGANCMGEVTELVAVLLMARLIVGNIAEVLIPMTAKFIEDFKLKRSSKKVAEREHKDNDNSSQQSRILPQWQTDYHLSESELDGVYSEYMEMMIQFAFIVLFTPAFPAAGVVCFLNNIAEIRVDACNILQTNRRPLPMRVSGIQIWNQFMDIIIKVGVLSNAALVAFTSDNLPYFYYAYAYAPGSDGRGYTRFTLSKIFVNDWGALKTEGHESINNTTECFYVGFRNDKAPYSLRDVYWPILTMRLAVFAAYCIVSFSFMWLINTCIDDTPSDVKKSIKRQQFLVQKAKETDDSLNVIRWATKQMIETMNHHHQHNHNHHNHHTRNSDNSRKTSNTVVQ